MMGGVDIGIPTWAGDSALLASFRAIRLFWRNAVVENGATGTRFAGYGGIPFEELEEVFVYQDRAAADLWDAEGAVPAALNKMIHLIADEQLTTVVVDEPDDPTMKQMVASIKSYLSNDIFSPVQVLEAAA